MKNGLPDADVQARLSALKDRIRYHIPHNIHEYEATWRGDKGLTHEKKGKRE